MTVNNIYSIIVHFHKLIEDWDHRKSTRFELEKIIQFLAQNHLRRQHVSLTLHQTGNRPKGQGQRALHKTRANWPIWSLSRSKTHSQCRIHRFKSESLSLKYFWKLYSFLQFFVFSEAFPHAQNSKIISLELTLGSNELWFRVRIYR